MPTMSGLTEVKAGPCLYKTAGLEGVGGRVLFLISIKGAAASSQPRMAKWEFTSKPGSEAQRPLKEKPSSRKNDANPSQASFKMVAERFENLCLNLHVIVSPICRWLAASSYL